MAGFSGHYLDGRSAHRHDVRVVLAANGLVITGAEGAEIAAWPYSEIAVLCDERPGEALRLACGNARLSLAEPGFGSALYEAAPALRPPSARRGLLRAAILVTLSVAGGALFWWSLPFATQAAVGLIPISFEERLGEQELRGLPLPACTREAGQKALDRLVARLTVHGDIPFHARAQVENVGIVNAFALPGGRIVLLRGLISAAQSADEVAGVLAHELTHSWKRHPLRHLLAHDSIELMFKIALGYGSSANAGALFADLTYSRAEEAEADAGALVLLREAGIGTAGFASFFERLSQGGEQHIPAYLSNHPQPADRLAAVRAGAAEGTTPALTPEEWKALKHICAPAEGDSSGKD